MPVVSPGYLVPRDVEEQFGFQTGLAPVNPAAGAAFTRIVPGAFFEVVLSVRCLFTTSAAAANRTVRLDVLDGDGNKIASLAATNNEAANTAIGYRWLTSISAPFTSGNTDINMPLFPFIMVPGWTLKIDANNIQAGDQFSLIGLILQQYNTGIQPERIETLGPVSTTGLGIVSVSGSSSPAPAATVTAPTSPTTPPPTSPSPSPSPSPPPITPPTIQEITDASAIGGPVIRE